MTFSRSVCAAVWFTVLSLFTVSGVFATEPPPAVQAEVAQLLNQIDNSGCQFYRNGSWHDAHKARSHLELKYRYLCSKGQVTCTEDVIDKAASVSSMSGKPYQIKCGEAAPVLSADWLKTELKRIRSQGNKS